MTVVRTQREDLRNVGIRFAAEQRLWNVRDGGRTVIIVALELLLENSPDPAHPLDLVKLMNLVRRHGGKETDPVVGVAVREKCSQSRKEMRTRKRFLGDKWKLHVVLRY
ncbi:hypothetical protein BHE74_00051578 [Ensete ventricosum]|nr:hypothetical protein BHE74_00051578 [Ensete ventricosum]